MKRTALFIASLTLALLAASSPAFAQAGVPSVANLVNFQGKLTTPAGNPVVDGPHMFIFRIYDLPAAGALQWSEGPLPIATTGGLFTHQLGSGTLLPVTLFEDFDSLYLEVEADGAIITPRTRLTPGPYTKVAGGLDGRSPYAPDSTYIKTFPFNHGLSTFGGDGQEQIRLWGPSWGEILLWDSDPTNDLGLIAAADIGTGTGGFVEGIGTSTWYLWAGTTGDGTAVLPTDAINAGEMLNEPGIAHSFNSLSAALTGVATNYDTVSLTAPTSGFVVVTATAEVGIDHTTGVDDLARVSISDVSGALDFDNIIFFRGNIANPTNTGFNEFLTLGCTKVEAVSAGAHTYYLVADEFAGTALIGRIHMTAMFFPTNYGTVVNSKPILSRAGGSVAASADGIGTGQSSEVEIITVEDSKAQLEAERAKQMAELEARIKKLEEAAKQQVVDDNR